ncbi:MAG: S1 RNA-binding domain-containing protein, partial [Anaerolineae bacterium]|nr:S1 RNA-binding domain-containing protein [Anaerolineae bacterium]
VKVLEVDWKRRRLVFSQRDARREQRESQKESLLATLNEGEVHRGVVSGLRDFGAFVDLGGADGLIHISELAWHRVRHPGEVLKVGQEIKVFILRLDEKGRRIGLSLKRLLQNPWERITEFYHVGQLVEGKVSRLADFGAFIRMEPGIEALLHLSQIGDPPPEHPSLVVHEGQDLLMRVVNIEPERQRLGLSLKAVLPEEMEPWQEKRRLAAEAEAARLAAEAEALEAQQESVEEQAIVAEVEV